MYDRVSAAAGVSAAFFRMVAAAFFRRVVAVALDHDQC